MRGRILLVTILGLAAMAACSKKDSIYIEPGKQDGGSSEPAKPAPAKPAPAQPAPAAEPTQTPPPKG